jgi:nucleoid DNA-binding protein
MTTTEKKLSAIRDPYTKSQVLKAISETTGLARKDVVAVFDSLSDLMHRHLKKRGAGEFTIPGICKLKVSQKPATKARKGINPFTKEEMTIAAKPARRVVRVRPTKAVKEMAES